MILLVPALLVSTGCAKLKSTTGKAALELAYSLVPGQSFTIKSEGTQRMESDQMGQVITVDILSSNETRYQVLTKKSDGALEMESEYITMKQSAESPMGDNDTDFSSWIGKKVQFTMSPQGKMSDYKGFDQLGEIGTATGEKISGEMVEENMSSIFFELPDHPLKLGESWTENDTRDIPYGGSTLKTESKTTYTVAGKLKKDGDNCLRIDIAGLTKLSGEFEQEGMKLSLTRETKVTGIIYFSTDKGMYISTETNSEAHGVVDLPDMGVTIPQDLIGKSSAVVIFN